MGFSSLPLEGRLEQKNAIQAEGPDFDSGMLITPMLKIQTAGHLRLAGQTAQPIQWVPGQESLRVCLGKQNEHLLNN